MSALCVYGGSCGGCMTCQDGRFYDEMEEPEAAPVDEEDFDE